MNGYCPLASGSKGNSIFFGTKNSKILIDAGISLLQLEKRLLEIDIELKDIDAILITHEHRDHIYGLKRLITKYDIPVLCNSETAKGIYDNLMSKPKFKIFTTGEAFSFKDLRIFPFSIQHDTLDPVAFRIDWENNSIGICADLGFVTTYVKECLRNCNYLYLEANHDVNMVHSSLRPQVYKNRVLGRQGHLSNEDCLSLLLSVDHSFLKHVFLAHLSQECNSKEKVLKIMKDKFKDKFEVDIAYQEKVSRKVLF